MSQETLRTIPFTRETPTHVGFQGVGRMCTGAGVQILLDVPEWRNWQALDQVLKQRFQDLLCFNLYSNSIYTFTS
jgi:hypothetical protein